MIDPIVNEVREIRERLASQFGFDIGKIVADARRRQATSKSRIVSFETPNKSLQPTGATIPASSDSTSAEAAPAAEL
jgi:hypothetical protein